MGYPSQTNVVEGIVQKTAAAAISAGYLVKLTSAGLVTPVTAANDRAMYVAAEDIASGASGACIPLSSDRQVRMKCGTVSGTQNAGVAVYLAASADGLVNEVSTSATKLGYAEEKFVTGQLVLVRPIPAS